MIELSFINFNIIDFPYSFWHISLKHSHFIGSIYSQFIPDYIYFAVSHYYMIFSRKNRAKFEFREFHIIEFRSHQKDSPFPD